VDHDKILDSSSVLELSNLPSSLAIIGGGYIGCEIGCLFAAMGANITIVEMKDTLLPNQEPKIQTALMNLFKKRKISFLTNTSVKDVTKTEQKVKLSLSNGQDLEADYLLIAVGNGFQTKELQLDKANIDTRPDNSIPVNENMQTNIPHIYAIGDINKTTMLAHGASHQATIAIDHILNIPNKKKSVLPFVVFTIPEIASVGLTSAQAKEQNIDFDTATFPYMASGMAQTLQKTEGFAILHYEKKTKKIIGAHVFGKEGSELIAEMTVAINQNLTLDDIAHTIYTHPTLSEIWHDTAMVGRKHSIHLPPQKQ
jgi:dihydrolipoamide dehydrogenase